MDRNDKILALVLVGTLATTVSIALAPQLSGKDFITLGIALISTFVAAFAGTWGAQVIAERGIARKSILDELRATNLALAMAYAIAETYLSAKKQHTNRLKEQYDRDLALYQARENAKSNGEELVPDTLGYKVDFRTLVPPVSPIDDLRQILFARITAPRPHLLLIPLMQSIDMVTNAIRARNEWIEHARAAMGQHDSESLMLRKYFGGQLPDGSIDRTYGSLIAALWEQNERCIGFSLASIDALAAHGESLRARYGNTAPKVAKPDFSPAVALGLVPDLKPYKAWAQASSSQ